MVVSQILFVVCGGNAGTELVDVANAVPTMFMALQDAVKMIVICCKKNEIKRVIISISDMWPTQMQSPTKKKTLKKWLRQLKILTDTIFMSGAIGLMVYEMAPFLMTMHGLYSDPDGVQYLYPLQSYFAHSPNAHWQYAMGYFYLFTTSVITHIVLYISSDLLLVSLAFHLSTLLDLLQIDLEDAVRNYDLDVEKSIRDVKDIVTRHQKLLWLADELNEIFGVHVFVQVSFSSIVICCFGFLTAIAQGVLLNNLCAVLGVVFAIWTLCWPGQLLADTSAGVAQAAYGSEWYNRDATFRRYIVLIMSRAQKPCYLTALGFSNLTLANFSKILSTSWSYLSLLNQMYHDSERRE